MSLPTDGHQEEMSAAPTREPPAVVSDPSEMEEVDLSSLLDLQDERQANEGKRANRVILTSCAGLLLLLVVWYALSGSSRRAIDGLIQNVKESRDELNEMHGSGGMSGAYDKILEKFGSRSTDIDTATRSLGVDPSTVQEDGMDAEMKAMMGGEGRTAGERGRVVEGLARLAGAELPKPPGRAPVAEPDAGR